MTVLAELPGSAPEALLFDLDGTLVDSVPDIAVAVDAMLVDLGFAVAGEQLVRGWVGNGARRLVQRALACSFGCDEDAVDESSLEVAHQRFLSHYQHSNGQHSRLYPGVRESLQAWHERGVAMALVTNKPIQFVPLLLQSLGIMQFFDVQLGGECVQNKKPHPEMLLQACRQLGVTPAQAIMVGDSRNDVEAARAAQMPVVAVDYGYNHGRSVACEQPDKIVSDLREFLPAPASHRPK